jgi:ribonuclease HII
MGERRVLGLDEAGRGSVIGPLVVGGFCLTESVSATLRERGVRDSKQLTAARREEVYDDLARCGEMRSVALPPRTIDRWVRHGRLNQLELAAFAEIVVELAPDVVYVDACDPNAERFGRQLAALSGGGVPVVARHRADETEPIVGAASIVAKVRRDRAIEALRRRLGDGVGSGYPSDPTTRAFVDGTVRAGGRCPAWLRESWAPVQRVKRSRSARTLDEFTS